MKKICTLTAIGFLFAALGSANTGECATKNPPAAPAGWTYKGKVCDPELASCGNLCLCATARVADHAKKIETFSCPCKGPSDVDIVVVDGLPELGTGLFMYSLSPYTVEGVVARAIGREAVGDLGPEALAGLTATVALVLKNGSVIEAQSEPLAGNSLDLAIEIPRVDPKRVASYTFTLGHYTEEGNLP